MPPLLEPRGCLYRQGCVCDQEKQESLRRAGHRLLGDSWLRSHLTLASGNCMTWDKTFSILGLSFSIHAVRSVDQGITKAGLPRHHSGGPSIREIIACEVGHIRESPSRSEGRCRCVPRMHPSSYSTDREVRLCRQVNPGLREHTPESEPTVTKGLLCLHRSGHFQSEGPRGIPGFGSAFLRTASTQPR